MQPNRTMEDIGIELQRLKDCNLKLAIRNKKLEAVAEATKEFWFLAGPSRDGGSLGTKQAVIEAQTKVTMALEALEGE